MLIHRIKSILEARHEHNLIGRYVQFGGGAASYGNCKKRRGAPERKKSGGNVCVGLHLEEDQASISNSAKEAQMQAANSTAQIENVNIKLADIRRTTKQAVTPADNKFTIEANQRP